MKPLLLAAALTVLLAACMDTDKAAVQPGKTEADFATIKKKTQEIRRLTCSAGAATQRC